MRAAPRGIYAFSRKREKTKPALTQAQLFRVGTLPVKEILGGAALQRCDFEVFTMTASAAEVNLQIRAKQIVDNEYSLRMTQTNQPDSLGAARNSQLPTTSSSRPSPPHRP